MMKFPAIIKSLCIGNEDGSLRIRNYPGFAVMQIITWRAEDEDGNLCACCMAVRCIALMAESFAIGFFIAR